MTYLVNISIYFVHLKLSNVLFKQFVTLVFNYVLNELVVLKIIILINSFSFFYNVLYN